MCRKLCQGVQPSTFAASSGSRGIANSPARIRIAKTEVLIQISAKAIENMASFASTSHGSAAFEMPSDCSALFTSPTLIPRLTMIPAILLN
jgi:hypothetical protein